MFGTRTDEQLISRALSGSERAWFAIIARYEQQLYNYCLRMTGNPDDAMDVLQDVLLSVYRNLATYRGDGVFVGWLFRIASFRCTDYYRRKGKDRLTDHDIEVMDETPAKDTTDNGKLLRLLSELTTDQRHVIELKFFQHFTFAEIAMQLGISSNTAKSRVYAALNKLRGHSYFANQMRERG
jgi:RNA polymerase sigma-70 factor, ECF subfamily